MITYIWYLYQGAFIPLTATLSGSYFLSPFGESATGHGAGNYTTPMAQGPRRKSKTHDEVPSNFRERAYQSQMLFQFGLGVAKVGNRLGLRGGVCSWDLRFAGGDVDAVAGATASSLSGERTSRDLVAWN